MDKLLLSLLLFLVVHFIQIYLLVGLSWVILQYLDDQIAEMFGHTDYLCLIYTRLDPLRARLTYLLIKFQFIDKFLYIYGDLVISNFFIKIIFERKIIYT